MVTQKMISVKLDVSQLEKLDKTCVDLQINRNKFLNFLVCFANEMLKDSKNLALIHAYSQALRAFKDE